jgi:hypothetical protein
MFSLSLGNENDPWDRFLNQAATRGDICHQNSKALPHKLTTESPFPGFSIDVDLRMYSSNRIGTCMLGLWIEYISRIRIPGV